MTNAAELATVEQAIGDLQRIWEDCLVALDSVLTPTQMRALLAIDRLAPLRLGQLAEELRSSPSPVSKVVDRLEKAGLVARTEDGRDARAVEIQLSPAGVTLATWTHERHRASLATVLDGMRSDQRSALVTALTDFCRSAHAAR